MFRYYTRRIFASPIFWICVIAQACIMVIGCYEDLRHAHNHVLSVLYCIYMTNAVGISHVLIPVITALPFLFFYVEELEKKTVYYQFIRSSRNACLLGQIGAAILSGIAVTMLATALFTVICLLYGAGWEADKSMQMLFEGKFFEKQISENLYLVYLVHCIALIWYSAPWSLCGMVISLFSKNRYLIIAAPYILFMALCYLTELLDQMWLNPSMTLLKGTYQSAFGGGIFYNLAYHGIWIVLLCVIYCVISRRKFRYEGI